MANVDQYLNQLAAPERAEYERIKKLVLAAAPEAEEVISYGMPTFKNKGKIVLHVGVFQDHMSVFPASDDMEKELGADITKLRTGKGTLQFTTDKPIPESLLKKIIAFRVSAAARGA